MTGRWHNSPATADRLGGQSCQRTPPLRSPLQSERTAGTQVLPLTPPRPPRPLRSKTPLHPRRLALPSPRPIRYAPPARPMTPDHLPLLRLTLVTGLGPILIRRVIARFGSPAGVLGASAAQLAEIPRIGSKLADAIARQLAGNEPDAKRELEQAAALQVRLVPLGDALYPPLLAQLDDAPPILYIRGSLEPEADHARAAAIVGSRGATAYGLEQAERFAGGLARAGLTVVSGGARGIDTAAHRGAIRAGGRTIAVLGCGLAKCYPPENAELFDRIAAGHGCVVSELPLATAPESDNFPARNRLISGMSLGVVVIEAGLRSGSLITARLAAEDHGREVMAVPGRVDSPASLGTHQLLKAGGASLVTDPADVLEQLRTPAAHVDRGTYETRYADPAKPPTLFAQPAASTPAELGLTPTQTTLLAHLAEARTLDELASLSGLAIPTLRVELTTLELQRRIRREGSRLVRT